ncbi:MAG: chain-length determining protein [Tannerellaceae bacterium]|nr:chain-length determining protein [Tannerellaceae bacterium]
MNRQHRIELIQKCWKARKFIGKVCGVAGIVAIIVAFSIPTEYSTVVKITPEWEGDAISPELYQDVVQSVPFLVELFSAEVTNEGKIQGIPFYKYLTKYHQKPWWTDLMGLPCKSISWCKGVFFRGIPVDEMQQGFISLTEEQQEVVELLRERLNVSVDKKTRIITVTVRLQEPIISTQIAQLFTENLQDYIINYRTQKAKQDYDFALHAFTDAKLKYYRTQETYVAFEEGSKNISSVSYRMEQARLQNDMSLTFGIYNTLAQKLEQDKWRIQEQTPVYTVIEPASIPFKASSPKKLLIFTCFIFLAFFGAIGYLMVKDSLLLLREIKRKTV